MHIRHRNWLVMPFVAIFALSFLAEGVAGPDNQLVIIDVVADLGSPPTILIEGINFLPKSPKGSDKGSSKKSSKKAELQVFMGEIGGLQTELEIIPPAAEG